MFNNEYLIYADGSLDSKGSGAGIVVWHPLSGKKETYAIPLGPQESSTHAEILAIVEALNLFHNNPDVHLEIFSDSKPAIACVRGQSEIYKAKEMQDRAKELLENIRRVRFHYMSAKTCDFTLEADNLAKRGVALNPAPKRTNKHGIAILDR